MLLEAPVCGLALWHSGTPQPCQSMQGQAFLARDAREDCMPESGMQSSLASGPFKHGVFFGVGAFYGVGSPLLVNVK